MAQERNGEIQGTVKDPAGAVVPNATITIRGVDVGFTRTLTTDDQGFYRAREVPPGLHNVEATATGFGVQNRTNVQVVLGQATMLDFDLAIGQGTNTIDITATDQGTTVDTTDSKVQENITAREIESLPKGTSFSSLLRTTTAVRPEPLSGQFSINGATGPENSFIVDGQEVNNFRTGVLNGNNDIPFQSVQEIQVKSSGFEAEFGGATGGVINIVTKSGTNQLRGEFGMQFATRKLDAGRRPVLAQNVNNDNPGNGFQFIEYLRERRDGGTDVFPTASLSGPIIKDKFWFYGIYSPRIFNTTRTTDFVSGFPGFGTGRNPQNFCAVATNPLCVSGAQTTQTATSKQTNEYAFLKLDASPTNTLRLSTSFTWNPIIVEGVLLGANTSIATPPNQNAFAAGPGFLQGADLAARQGGRQNSNNFRVEGVWTPTSKLVTTLRYSRGFLNERAGAYAVPNIPRIRCRNVPVAQREASGCFTGYQSTQSNFQTDVDASTRNNVDADASYLLSNFAGRHEFKGGYQFSRINNEVRAGYRANGYSNLYYNATALNPSFNCAGFSPATTIATPANAIGRGCLIRFATQGQASNTAHALYVQDKWQPINRLTFNLGVRTEQENLPAFNGSQTGLQFSFKDKLAPRVGVAYDLTGDGKTRVSAFYGWFFDRLKFELPRGSFGGDFFRLDFFHITSDNPSAFFYNAQNVIGNFNDPIGGVCPPGGIPVTGGTRTRCQLDYRIPSNVTLSLDPNAPVQSGAVDPNLKPFRQSEFNVEFQREVMRSTVAKARYIHRNVDSAIEDAGFQNANGSEFYIIANPGEGLHAERGRALGYERFVKPQRRYDALQLELDTRFIRNLGLNVNYVFSRLYGNYSGLANSDEGGRLSPGVNRLFDLPFVGFTAAGQPDNGRLPLDRPHVFKASGAYDFDWMGSKANSTNVGFFTTVQSGTPQTTFVDIFYIPIPLSVRGDLGRTERFTQTDLNLSHRYRFGRDERFAMVFDVNVLNVFNEHNVLAINTTQENPFLYVLAPEEVAPAGSTNVFRDAINILTRRGVLNELRASQGTFQTNPENFNAAYRLPSSFQGPRTVRFGFRLMF